MGRDGDLQRRIPPGDRHVTVARPSPDLSRQGSRATRRESGPVVQQQRPARE